LLLEGHLHRRHAAFERRLLNVGHVHRQRRTGGASDEREREGAKTEWGEETFQDGKVVRDKRQ